MARARRCSPLREREDRSGRRRRSRPHKVTAIVTDLDGNELARKTLWSGDIDTITGVPAGQVKVRFEGAKVVTEW